jgi:DNA-binding HxlR family transcriptional regulator
MRNILRIKTDGQRPILGGYDFFWSQILAKTAKGDSFTYRDIDRACGPGHENMLTRFLRLLVKNGYVEAVATSDKPAQPRVYQLIKRQSDPPKFSRDGKIGKKGAAQQQLWNAIRRSAGGFQIADLALSASTDEVPISYWTAKDYCGALAKAGILKPIGVTKRRGTVKSYVLLGAANTGPKAPVRYQVKLIFDPNTGLVVGDSEGEEVDA